MTCDASNAVLWGGMSMHRVELGLAVVVCIQCCFVGGLPHS